jgi:hypothetical protein
MSSSFHIASSSACIVSMERTAQRRKRVDFATGYCGLSPPTLFERIGIMAADGQPLPTRFRAACSKCARRRELAQRTGSPSSGPEARAGLPVKTTQTSIGPGPARAPSRARLDNRKRMAVAEPSSRPIATHHLGRHGMNARAGPFV